MAAPTLITELSQTAASNGPDGASTSPKELDNYQRAHAGFIAMLRDGKGHAATVSVASATTTDIGAANSLAVEITGTTTITGFGTAYNGPRLLRFAGALTLTHSSTLTLPGAVNITTAAGDTCLAVPNLSANGWIVLAYQRADGGGVSAAMPLTRGGTGATTAAAALAAIAPSSYTLGPIRTYTSNDTWTKPSGLRGVRVRVQGGGGGGAGALGASAQTGLGSGGGGGGYSEKWIAAGSLGVTETVTVGAAGTAGAATPTGGGNGGQSSFGAHAVAAGGVGGSSLSAGTSATVGGAVGTGGAGSSGDLNCSGGPGAMAYRFSGTNGFGGNGGSAVLGGGGAGAGAGGGGNTGGNYGGGGGGGNSDSTTGRVGGAGGAGVVIVEEYF